MLIYKLLRRAYNTLANKCDTLRTRIILWGNDVRHGSFRTSGVPYVMVARGGRMTIGERFAMNNGVKGNPIGSNRRCTFFVDRGAEIVIGDNVGMSQAALVAHDKIEVQNNVKIGGGAVVYTSDFHSLDASIRATGEDMKHRKTSPVTICHDAFIGAQCIILKGVTIGACSIIGAGSVVTKSVPEGEIWAGNPAKFIRKI